MNLRNRVLDLGIRELKTEIQKHFFIPLILPILHPNLGAG